MRRALAAGPGLLKALWIIGAWFAAPSQASTSIVTVDLGDERAKAEQRLGVPLRAWSPSHCPGQRVELRRRGSLWLKLVYGPDERVHAAGVFRLAAPSPSGPRAQRRVVLRWPGLTPGSAGRSAYPAAGDWRPLMWLIGAKQWLWLEESVSPLDPPDRARYLGGVVVDDASAFAAGTGFPYDIADAVTATGRDGADWAEAGMAQPLLAWRRRTPPNAYIETLTKTVEPAPGCGSLTLVLPTYTDFSSL